MRIRADVTVDDVCARLKAGATKRGLAREFGTDVKVIRRRAQGIEPLDRYTPVAPFRDAAEGRSTQQIALRLGWFDRGAPDIQRVLRVLGLRPYPMRGGGWCVREHVTLDMAARLCEAMELDPWEVGL